ncbi:MAG: outer membrane beta-barrel protein [Thiomonas sp.]|uniref:outer membrane protein n=1 Tax=Thiomonas sp. TaxID=2047785 RepID=UPI002A35C786|nr:outer membrane beta-barrel protein [Thiomonas sp.]MDY0331139.1 outer membrane beta-barrel protein [Thiomonas sp.]
MKSARILLTAAALLACGAAKAADVACGPSARPQSYAVSLRGSGWLAPEIEFVSEGRQPDHIPNINRVLMLNAVATANLTDRLQGFVKAGLASSRWSTNGSGNGYRSPGRFGYDVGAGLTYWLTPRWGLRLETLYMHHQQSDVPQFEHFTQTVVQVVWRWR